MISSLRCSDRRFAALVSADTNHFFEWHYEDFAIADLARLGGFHDRLHGFASEVIGDRDLDFNFRQEIYGVFAAPIDLGVALLTAIAFDLGDRHALDADGTERFLHFIQFERFDNSGDEFHKRIKGVGFLVDVTFFAVIGDVEALGLGFGGGTQTDQSLHEHGDHKGRHHGE